MEQTLQPTTELDIKARVVNPHEPSFAPAFANEILALRFFEADLRRMNELAEKNRNDALTPLERADLEKYLRVGQFIDLLQAKARVSLKNSNGAK